MKRELARRAKVMEELKSIALVNKQENNEEDDINKRHCCNLQ
jgi:hypothetical protein